MDQLVTETASNLLSLFRSGFLKYIDCKQSKIVAQFWEYEENASCDSNVTLIIGKGFGFLSMLLKFLLIWKISLQHYCYKVQVILFPPI